MSLFKRTRLAALLLSVAAPLAFGPAVLADQGLPRASHQHSPFEARVCIEEMAANLATVTPVTQRDAAADRVADITATLHSIQSNTAATASPAPAPKPFVTRKALWEAAAAPASVQAIDIDYVTETLAAVASLRAGEPVVSGAIHFAQVDEDPIEPDPSDLDAVYRDPAPIEVEAQEIDAEPVQEVAEEFPAEETAFDADEDMAEPSVDLEPAVTVRPQPAIAQTSIDPATADAMLATRSIQRSITPVHLLDEVLSQRITANFRDTDVADVLAILARRAGVNVVHGTAVTGSVTLYLKDVPLRQAMDLALQQNNLGIIQEENVFRIVPLQEAQQANRISRTIYLANADPDELSSTLESVIMTTMDSALTSISVNKTTRALIISGPPRRVHELTALANELDVAEPALPTITEAIHLNYSEPTAIRAVIQSMLTPQLGVVEVDDRSRTVIVTDVPVVIEQVRAMLITIDRPVKQVGIHAMLVDVVLRDSSAIGTNWVLDLVRRRSRSGELVGNLENLSFGGNLGNVGSDALNAGILNVGVIGRGFNLQASIAAETASGNSEILANPMVVTVENKPATIAIVQDFPYQEITQTTQGPPVATTAFKEIGIKLDVTPRVTNDDHVIVTLDAKQSSVSGLTQDGIPIEDKREASTTLRVADQETIFIGGLRNVSDRLDVSKVPVLGDIPVINFMFRNTDAQKINTELMIFLTCEILGESLPMLTAEQEIRHEAIHSHPRVPNAEQVMFRNLTHPGEFRDPMWKWRRPE
jgi:general secretion pathway protein D